MVCGALGLCQSEQAALAKVEVKEQLTSNEIPMVDLSQPASPFLLNVPLLLYPQDTSKQEAPKQETEKEVRYSDVFRTRQNVFYLLFFGSDLTFLNYFFTIFFFLPP